MFCWIFKWKISKFHDRNIRPGGLTARHLNRCGGCRNFDRSLHALDDRLRRSAPGFLQAGNKELVEKVMSGLEKKPEKAGRISLRSGPVLAAAASLVIIVAGLLVVSRWIPGGKSPADDKFSPGATAAFRATVGLKGIETGMESAFEQELRRLGRHLKSAARSLSDGLFTE